MILHSCHVRVYWEDTDAGGIVYHSNYLNFAERARTEFVRELGVSQHELSDGGKGFAFAVSHLEVNFKRSARLDDVLDVESRVVEVNGASVRFDQRIVRVEDGVELTRLNVRLGFVALDGGRPSRIPQHLRQRLHDKLSER